MKVKNVRLRTVTVDAFIALGDPQSCQHEWEQHLWEVNSAYCAKCGSYAERDLHEVKP